MIENGQFHSEQEKLKLAVSQEVIFYVLSQIQER